MRFSPHFTYGGKGFNALNGAQSNTYQYPLPDTLFGENPEFYIDFSSIEASENLSNIDLEYFIDPTTGWYCFAKDGSFLFCIASDLNWDAVLLKFSVHYGESGATLTYVDSVLGTSIHEMFDWSFETMWWSSDGKNLYLLEDFDDFNVYQFTTEIPYDIQNLILKGSISFLTVCNITHELWDITMHPTGRFLVATYGELVHATTPEEVTYRTDNMGYVVVGLRTRFDITTAYRASSLEHRIPNQHGIVVARSCFDSSGDYLIVSPTTMTWCSDYDENGITGFDNIILSFNIRGYPDSGIDNSKFVRFGSSTMEGMFKQSMAVSTILRNSKVVCVELGYFENKLLLYDVDFDFSKVSTPKFSDIQHNANEVLDYETVCSFDENSETIYGFHINDEETLLLVSYNNGTTDKLGLYVLDVPGDISTRRLVDSIEHIPLVNFRVYDNKIYVGNSVEFKVYSIDEHLLPSEITLEYTLPMLSAYMALFPETAAPVFELLGLYPEKRLFKVFGFTDDGTSLIVMLDMRHTWAQLKAMFVIPMVTPYDLRTLVFSEAESVFVHHDTPPTEENGPWEETSSENSLEFSCVDFSDYSTDNSIRIVSGGSPYVLKCTIDLLKYNPTNVVGGWVTKRLFVGGQFSINNSSDSTMQLDESRREAVWYIHPITKRLFRADHLIGETTAKIFSYVLPETPDKEPLEQMTDKQVSIPNDYSILGGVNTLAGWDLNVQNGGFANNGSLLFCYGEEPSEHLVKCGVDFEEDVVTLTELENTPVLSLPEIDKEGQWFWSSDGMNLFVTSNDTTTLSQFKATTTFSVQGLTLYETYDYGFSSDYRFYGTAIHPEGNYFCVFYDETFDQENNVSEGLCYKVFYMTTPFDISEVTASATYHHVPNMFGAKGSAACFDHTGTYLFMSPPATHYSFDHGIISFKIPGSANSGILSTQLLNFGENQVYRSDNTLLGVIDNSTKVAYRQDNNQIYIHDLNTLETTECVMSPTDTIERIQWVFESAHTTGLACSSIHEIFVNEDESAMLFSVKINGTWMLCLYTLSIPGDFSTATLTEVPTTCTIEKFVVRDDHVYVFNGEHFTVFSTDANLKPSEFILEYDLEETLFTSLGWSTGTFISFDIINNGQNLLMAYASPDQRSSTVLYTIPMITPYDLRTLNLTENAITITTLYDTYSNCCFAEDGTTVYAQSRYTGKEDWLISSNVDLSTGSLESVTANLVVRKDKEPLEGNVYPLNDATNEPAGFFVNKSLNRIYQLVKWTDETVSQSYYEIHTFVLGGNLIEPTEIEFHSLSGYVAEHPVEFTNEVSRGSYIDFGVINLDEYTQEFLFKKPAGLTAYGKANLVFNEFVDDSSENRIGHLVCMGSETTPTTMGLYSEDAEYPVSLPENLCKITLVRSDGYLKLYINGVYVEQQPSTPVSDKKWLIGANPYSNRDTGALIGTISNIAIYNYAKADTTIASEGGVVPDGTTGNPIRYYSGEIIEGQVIDSVGENDGVWNQEVVDILYETAWPMATTPIMIDDTSFTYGPAVDITKIEYEGYDPLPADISSNGRYKFNSFNTYHINKVDETLDLLVNNFGANRFGASYCYSPDGCTLYYHDSVDYGNGVTQYTLQVPFFINHFAFCETTEDIDDVGGKFLFAIHPSGRFVIQFYTANNRVIIKRVSTPFMIKTLETTPIVDITLTELGITISNVIDVTFDATGAYLCIVGSTDYYLSFDMCMDEQEYVCQIGRISGPIQYASNALTCGDRLVFINNNTHVHVRNSIDPTHSVATTNLIGTHPLVSTVDSLIPIQNLKTISQAPLSETSSYYTMCCINEDETILVVDYDDVFAGFDIYRMSTPGDVTTATLVRRELLSDDWSVMVDFGFQILGNRLYVSVYTDEDGDCIYEYTFGENWETNGLVLNYSQVIPLLDGENEQIWSFSFSPNGEFVYLMYYLYPFYTHPIHKIPLITPYDFRTLDLESPLHSVSEITDVRPKQSSSVGGLLAVDQNTILVNYNDVSSIVKYTTDDGDIANLHPVSIIGKNLNSGYSPGGIDINRISGRIYVMTYDDLGDPVVAVHTPVSYNSWTTIPLSSGNIVGDEIDPENALFSVLYMNNEGTILLLYEEWNNLIVKYEMSARGDLSTGAVTSVFHVDDDWNEYVESFYPAIASTVINGYLYVVMCISDIEHPGGLEYIRCYSLGENYNISNMVKLYDIQIPYTTYQNYDGEQMGFGGISSDGTRILFIDSLTLLDEMWCINVTIPTPYDLRTADLVNLPAPIDVSSIFTDTTSCAIYYGEQPNSWYAHDLIHDNADGQFHHQTKVLIAPDGNLGNAIVSECINTDRILFSLNEIKDPRTIYINKSMNLMLHEQDVPENHLTFYDIIPAGGKMKGFTDATLSTLAATDMTTDSATLQGLLVDDEYGVLVTETGFLWGTSPESLTHLQAVGNSVGNFSHTITGLTQDMVYYFRAYATDGTTTLFGEILSAETEAEITTDGHALIVSEYGNYACSSDYGHTWTIKDTGNQYWDSCSLLPDGHALMVGGGGDYAYSSDYGNTWTIENTGNHDWMTCSLLPDGHAIIVGYFGNYAYSSDYGHTWTTVDTGNHTWRSCSLLPDGRALMVGNSGYYAYSSDYGHTWTFGSVGTNIWYNCSLLPDGRALIVGRFGDYAYSSDYGHTWTTGDTGDHTWRGCSLLPDGRALMVGDSGYYACSSDYGHTWTFGRVGTKNWADCSLLPDGHAHMVGVGGSYACSSDYGHTWTTVDTGNHTWQGCSMI